METGRAPRTAARALAEMPAFAGLDATTLEALGGAGADRHYDAGEVLYLEGEPATSIYILKSGWVKATRMSPEGREQSLSVLHSVDLFGDIAVLAGTPYPGSVVALEPVDVSVIDRRTFLDLIARHPPLAQAVIRLLAQRVLHFIGLVEDLSLRSVEARLANTLLKHAQVIEGQLVVPRRQWTTLDEMATRLGTVRDVLSRTLRALEQDGLLEVGRRQIVISDPQGLARRGTPG